MSIGLRIRRTDDTYGDEESYDDASPYCLSSESGGHRVEVGLLLVGSFQGGGTVDCDALVSRPFVMPPIHVLQLHMDKGLREVGSETRVFGLDGFHEAEELMVAGAVCRLTEETACIVAGCVKDEVRVTGTALQVLFHPIMVFDGQGYDDAGLCRGKFFGRGRGGGNATTEGSEAQPRKSNERIPSVTPREAHAPITICPRP